MLMTGEQYIESLRKLKTRVYMFGEKIDNWVDLRDRFGIVARLEFYTPDELARIVTRSAALLNVPADAPQIMQRSGL